MTTDKSDAKTAKWTWSTIVWIAVVLVFVVYPLSIGLAAWVVAKIDHDEQGWSSGIFYALSRPIAYAAGMSRTEGILATYLGWFVESNWRVVATLLP